MLCFSSFEKAPKGFPTRHSSKFLFSLPFFSVFFWLMIIFFVHWPCEWPVLFTTHLLVVFGPLSSLVSPLYVPLWLFDKESFFSGESKKKEKSNERRKKELAEWSAVYSENYKSLSPFHSNEKLWPLHLKCLTIGHFVAYIFSLTHKWLLTHLVADLPVLNVGCFWVVS